MELDRESIRLSQRYGLSTPYRFTIWNSVRLFHHVLFNIGDLHLVLPALNLSTLNAGILIMMKQVLTEHGGRLHVLSLAVQLRFICRGQEGGTILNISYPSRFFLWNPSFMLKSYDGVVGDPWYLVSA